MDWKLSSDRPVYIQIVEQLERKIVSGILDYGERLPSVRELALDAGVNPNTMQRALAEIERSGLIYTERTNGKYITKDKELIFNMKKTSAKSEIIEFLNKMNQLGLKNEEVIKLLVDTQKELGK